MGNIEPERESTMNKMITALCAAAMLPLASLSAAPRDGEAELSRALQGRVAGAPVDCINLRQIRSSRIINNTAILYEAGGTVYVNRPRAGREQLDQWDTLVTRLHDNRLCSVDTVRLYDAGSRIETGFVFLGEFVPYRRAR